MSSPKEKNRFLNIQEIPSKLINQLIIHVLTSIGAILIALFATLKLADLFTLDPLQKVFLISGTLFVAAGLIIYLFRKKYNRYIAQFEPAQSNFHVIEKEFTHQYLELEKIIHKRRWILKALRDGLDSFNDKFFWTGGKWDWKSTIENHKVIHTGNRNLYDLYMYQFDRTLKKGDTIEIEVEWTLYGPHKYFFSTPIEEPTDLLKMCISFPIEWKIQKILCDESGIQGAKLPDSQLDVNLTRGSHNWVKPHPKLFHHYEIKWNLNQASSQKN